MNDWRIGPKVMSIRHSYWRWLAARRTRVGARPVLRMTAAQLVDDFSRDATAAQLKYTGNLIQVSGQILAITRAGGENGEPVVVLSAGAEGRDVMCWVASVPPSQRRRRKGQDNSMDTLAALAAGQHAVLWGRFDQMMTPGDETIVVLLRDCGVRR